MQAESIDDSRSLSDVAASDLEIRENSPANSNSPIDASMESCLLQSGDELQQVSISDTKLNIVYCA